MKMLMAYLYVFFSLGCLSLVASGQDMNEWHVLFWTCVSGVAVLTMFKRLKKQEGN